MRGRPVRWLVLTGSALATASCSSVERLNPVAHDGSTSSATVGSTGGSGGGGLGGAAVGGSGATGGVGGEAMGGAGGEAPCFEPPGTEILLHDLLYVDPFTKLAIDDEYLYVTSPINDGIVSRVPKAGGAPELLASGEADPWGLEVTSTELFWFEWNPGTAIRKMPKAGGPVVTVVNAPTPAEGFHVDGPHVYFVTIGAMTGAVYRAPTTGGQVELLAPLQYGGSGIVVDRADAYVHDGILGMRVPKDGGAAVPLGGPTFDSFEHPVAVDADAAYFAGGSVVRFPKNGDPPSVLVDVDDYRVTELRVDATHVYWTNWETETVERASKTVPGTAEVLVRCAINLESDELVLDEGWFYWIDGGNDFGALKRAPK